ncbi:hypothetical protein HPB49_023871 [Dermacentor silvarum]|uniref:Uncharacterized protein n=1 Tax=Dermacentor silvarum TaxID=543639 RepID=A0ACB8CI19_DERSI|nr:hypothetical protein HPB49_023871 [Dermacentor silvarum]
MALSMTTIAAKGNTKDELSLALYLEECSHKIAEYIGKFVTEFSAPDLTIHVVNRAYTARELKVRRDYLSLLERSFRATVKSVDFRNNAEAVRKEANAWVSQQTKSKINDLLAPDTVTSETLFILLSAVYFKAKWNSPFEWRDNRRDKFYVNGVKVVEVNMMNQMGEFMYAHSEELDAQILEMPYKGNKFSMIILLPNNRDGLSGLEKNLTDVSLNSALANLALTPRVEVTLPKFKIERRANMKKVFKGLGIKDLFDQNRANLSGMFETVPGQNPFVTEFVHKAFIEVNENGTEAAASTAVVVGNGSAGPQKPSARFFVDHPFMFLIKGYHGNIVLFLGSVRKL